MIKSYDINWNEIEIDDIDLNSEENCLIDWDRKILKIISRYEAHNRKNKPYYFESDGQALINHDRTLIKILI
jgi:hypothetical protein